MLGPLGAGLPLASISWVTRTGLVLSWLGAYGRPVGEAGQVLPDWWRAEQAGGGLDRQGMTVWVTSRQQEGVGKQGVTDWCRTLWYWGPCSSFHLGWMGYVRTFDLPHSSSSKLDSSLTWYKYWIWICQQVLDNTSH